MGNRLSGQVAMLAGPLNDLTEAAARRLGNEGSTVALIGTNIRGNKRAEDLLCQFGPNVDCLEIPFLNGSNAEMALSWVERRFGPPDIFFYTLGCEGPPANLAAWRLGGHTAVGGLISSIEGTRAAFQRMRVR